MQINLDKLGSESKYKGIKKVKVTDIISNCVEDIWDEFDDDGNGYLDKEETLAFVKRQLLEMGESTEFSLLDFEACFKQHKDNDDGLVTKEEMIDFIGKVVGVEVEQDEKTESEAD